MAPPPCSIPSFHVQQECHDDLLCLVTEFTKTLQAESQVEFALKICPNIVRRPSGSPEAR